MSETELWYVKTADGDVDRMSLDQLDEAFNAGAIDEHVMVLPAGEQNWVKLGALLGLDQPPPAPPQAAAAPRQAPAPMAPAFALPASIRPVSLDLSDDLDDAPFAKKKSRKGMVVGALVAVAAVAGIAVAATRAASHVDTSTATASMVAPPPVADPTPPPAPPSPEPTPASTSTAAPIPDHGLTDDQKARLAAADKVRDDKSKSRKKARGAGATGGHGSKYRSQGFTSGGNKYDPLNANL